MKYRPCKLLAQCYPYYKRHPISLTSLPDLSPSARRLWSYKMSKFGLDLNKIYGKKYKQNFNPQIRNIRTGARAKKAHHCLECSNATKTSCYEKLHCCYCVAPITDQKGKVMEDKNGEALICGERFQSNSPGGCFAHPYNHGYNLMFKEARRGKVLSPEAKVVMRKEAALATGDKSYHWYNEQRKIAAYK